MDWSLELLLDRHRQYVFEISWRSVTVASRGKDWRRAVAGLMKVHLGPYDNNFRILVGSQLDKEK